MNKIQIEEIQSGDTKKYEQPTAKKCLVTLTKDQATIIFFITPKKNRHAKDYEEGTLVVTIVNDKQIGEIENAYRQIEHDGYDIRMKLLFTSETSKDFKNKIIEAIGDFQISLVERDEQICNINESYSITFNDQNALVVQTYTPPCKSTASSRLSSNQNVFLNNASKYTDTSVKSSSSHHSLNPLSRFVNMFK